MASGGLQGNDLDNSYEETQMNPNGFFNECNDQVSIVDIVERLDAARSRLQLFLQNVFRQQL